MTFFKFIIKMSRSSGTTFLKQKSTAYLPIACMHVDTVHTRLSLLGEDRKRKLKKDKIHFGRFAALRPGLGSVPVVLAEGSGRLKSQYFCCAVNSAWPPPTLLGRCCHLCSPPWSWEYVEMEAAKQVSK